MKYKISFAALLSITFLMLNGCSDSKSNDGLTFTNDMETAFAFSEHPQGNIVYFKNAHSGKYVCIIDSTSLFSVGYHMKAKNIYPEPLHKVTVGAWFNAQQTGSDAQLVIDIQAKDGSRRDWIGHSAREFLTKTGEWEWVEMTLDLTVKNLNDIDNTFHIYAYNNSGSSVLVDDLQIRFEK